MDHMWCCWVPGKQVKLLVEAYNKKQTRLMVDLGKIPWHTFKPILQTPKATLEPKRRVCLSVYHYRKD